MTPVAFLDHQLGAAFLARRRHLLGRLEDELHGAAQALAQAGEDARHAHQHGDVGVVAAGMHDADVLAVPDRADLGGEGHVGALLHRQAVHVGTQGDHRAREAAVEHADDAGDRHLGPHLVEAERAQVRRDDAGGAELAVAELGVGVEVAPPGEDLRLQGGRLLVDGRGKAAGFDAAG
jgi:hypothetical protein